MPFVLAGGGRRIELRLGPNYRFFQLYAPSDDDVIAYEAMTAPTNALVSGADLPLLEPGRQVRGELLDRDHGAGRLSTRSMGAAAEDTRSEPAARGDAPLPPSARGSCSPH